MANSDVISAFRDGVTNDRMLEKLGIRDDLTSAAELIDMADRCAKAEEGHLLKHNAPLNEPTAAVSKGKNKAKGDNADTKRKAPAILAAEPERRYKRDDGTPEVDNRLLCAFHQMYSHATENCFQLERPRGECLTRNGQEGSSRGGGWRGFERGGGRSGGRWSEPYQNGYGGGFHNNYYGGGYGGYYQQQPQQLQQPYPQIGRAHV